MATLLQEPNYYNAAYVPNVWTVDVLGTADRFVLSVYITGIAGPVATFKQPANPSGVAHFDVQKVLQSYLEPYFVEETQFFASTPGAHRTYQVRYGTETDNLVTYDGYSVTKHVINGYDNWRVLNSDLSNYLLNPDEITCENTNINARYLTPVSFLTNFPNETYKVRSNEYKTLSFFTQNTNIGPNWGPNEAPFFAHIQYFLNSVQVSEVVFTIGSGYGSDIRLNCQDMTTNITEANTITTMGVGPQNFTDAGINPPTHDAYTVHIHSYNNCIDTTIQDCQDFGEILSDGYLGDIIYEADFEVVNECSPFDPITVSFVNQYGVKDYYTFDRRNTRQLDTNRNDYSKTLGTWSEDVFSINQHNGGKTVFSAASTTRMSLQTNWMTDATSEWLQELFISSTINIYVDGKWEPCVINTRQYNQKTYARDRMFQHELEVEFANNQKIQRG